VPDQKQGHVPKPLSNSSPWAESSSPKEWHFLGVSLLFLHHAVDHMRRGFGRTFRTNGRFAKSIDLHPKLKELTAIVYVKCVGYALHKAVSIRDLARS
jgi:hypothetical protein